MIQTDKWIYLHLQKTGGTFIEAKLREIFRGSSALEVLRKHHREQEIIKGRLRVMNIRDPIHYYFSLWSYGLESEGGFYRRLSRTLSREKLNAIYGSVSEEAFDAFICECFKQGEHDLYTQRTLTMMIPESDTETLSMAISSPIDSSFYDSFLLQYVPDILLPTERLNEAFHLHADRGGLDPLGLPADWKTVFPLNSPEINQSHLSRQAHMGQFDRNKIISSTSYDVIAHQCLLPNILYKLALHNLGWSS